MCLLFFFTNYRIYSQSTFKKSYINKKIGHLLDYILKQNSRLFMENYLQYWLQSFFCPLNISVFLKYHVLKNIYIYFGVIFSVTWYITWNLFPHHWIFLWTDPKTEINIWSFFLLYYTSRKKRQTVSFIQFSSLRKKH